MTKGDSPTPARPPSKILVAPTEPKLLRAMGKTTLTPERFGVDYLWRSHDGKFCGVQRKEFPGDFVASMDDGRMSTELSKMLRLQELGGFACLVIEGDPRWGHDGELLDKYKRYSRSRFESFLASLQLRYGVSYWITEDIPHTGALVRALHGWTQRTDHNSLATRPKQPNGWGLESRIEQACHFMQGLPACGTIRSRLLVEHFGGVPVAWRCTREDLRAIPGIGKETAERWFRFLGGGLDDPLPRAKTKRVRGGSTGDILISVPGLPEISAADIPL